MADLDIKPAKELFADVFNAIDRELERKDKVIVAIEGNSGAGKSYLAKLIANRYDCNIFHMDDFFLQSHQRTKERFEEAGGNIDYERFKREVVAPLMENLEFKYQLFDCQQAALAEFIHVIPKQLNIIEGVYSMHPLWNEIYDIRIFLSVEPEVQLKRILQRNGEFMLKRFQEEWIPLENKYFEACQIAAQCDFMINTGLLI
jgi:uridine kinase